MIKLTLNEKVEIYQVELTLQVKTKQSPFIAILILAKENNGVTANSLHHYLLPTIPLRACENLLLRLLAQGYFIKNESDGSYSLSEKGEGNATDHTFWIGEKGLYNVFICNSNLISQNLIHYKKVEKPENHKENDTINTPEAITIHNSKVLKFNTIETLIEDTGNKCYQLASISCALELIANDDDVIIKINNDKSQLYTTPIDLTEARLKKHLLNTSKDFIYDFDKNAVLVDFNSDEISFIRNVMIRNPKINQNSFDPIEIKNVNHLPTDDRNALQWFNELLYRNVDQYFVNEFSLNELASEIVRPFRGHYNVLPPTRHDLISQFKKRENSFYKTAKLETIDYLNY